MYLLVECSSFSESQSLLSIHRPAVFVVVVNPKGSLGRVDESIGVIA